MKYLTRKWYQAMQETDLHLLLEADEQTAQNQR